jgi:hypothetical protein
MDRVENTVHCCAPTVSVGTCLLAKALLRNGCVYLLINNLLPSSGCCLVFASRSLPSKGSTCYNITLNKRHKGTAKEFTFRSSGLLTHVTLFILLSMWFPSLVGTAAGARTCTFTSIWCRSQECWIYTSAPPPIFMAWCLIKHRDNLFVWLVT